MNVRCASCGHAFKWKEERTPKLLALFRRTKDRDVVLPPDIPCSSRRCRHCGWINLFEVMDTAISAT